MLRFEETSAYGITRDPSSGVRVRGILLAVCAVHPVTGRQIALVFTDTTGNEDPFRWFVYHAVPGGKMFKYVNRPLHPQPNLEVDDHNCYVVAETENWQRRGFTGDGYTATGDFKFILNDEVWRCESGVVTVDGRVAICRPDSELFQLAVVGTDDATLSPLLPQVIASL